MSAPQQPDSASSTNSASTLLLARMLAPVSGVVVPLAEVPDPVFSQGVVGPGLAIDPTSNTIVSPFDGVITQFHSHHHAVAIRANRGDLEVLIHVGLDTIRLQGEGFTPLAQKGDQVHAGTPLLRFDLPLIATKAKSLLTEIIFTQLPARSNFYPILQGQVAVGEEFIDIREALPAATPASASVSASASASTTAAASAKALRQTVQKWPHSRPIEILNPTGLHARPAAQIVQTAKRFPERIMIVKGEKIANARSLVEIMGLEIDKGDFISIAVEGGSGAQKAIDALVNEIKSGLGEQITSSTSTATTIGEGGSSPRNTSETKVSSATTTEQTQKISDNDKVFRGVSASPGFAIGRLFHLKREVPLVEIERQPNITAESEKQRLQAALKIAIHDLENLKNRLQNEADHSEATIFGAHIELLEDPTMLDSTQSLIHEGKSAEYAWKQAFETQAHMLEGLKNQLLAARANDLRDVGLRVLKILLGKETPSVLKAPPDSILISEDLAPSDVATLDRSHILGFCTTTGGATSHVAILARSLDLPAVAGMDPRILNLPEGSFAILDAVKGELRLQPSEQEKVSFLERMKTQQERKKKEEEAARDPAQTKDGHRIHVVANLKAASESKGCLNLGAEGVGLLRTEFLFMDRSTAPSEEEQLQSYREIAENLSPGQPLIIRTLDAGGDKPLTYLPLPKEDNPFLGERGIRVSLRRPELFRTQLRAILRASAYGNVHILLPMISVMDEVRESLRLINEEKKNLKIDKHIPVGIMIEVPSAAMLAHQFAGVCDFFSIGSNDLTQYTLAIDRGHPKLAPMVDGLDPSILALIERSVQAAKSFHKLPVGVCGGIAGDMQAVAILIGLGVDELSVSLPSVPAVKALIRTLDLKACQKLAQDALKKNTAQEVRSLVDQFHANVSS